MRNAMSEPRVAIPAPARPPAGCDRRDKEDQTGWSAFLKHLKECGYGRIEPDQRNHGGADIQKSRTLI